jgi:dihydroxyacetone kinase
VLAGILAATGAAGAEQVDFAGARTAVAMVAARLLPHLGPGDHVALLNNLGGTTPLEMSVLAAELARSALGPRVKRIVGPAATMTALDMHGFPISLLPAGATEDDLNALDARTGDGADATAAMTRARAGRARCLSAERLAGFNDPGAEAVARVFAALARG